MLGKILIVLASASLIASATAPAHAGWANGISLNGAGENGFQFNGLQLNGFIDNGISLNGGGTNGLQLNGGFGNGMSLQGTAPGSSRLAIDGIELPAAQR